MALEQSAPGGTRELTQEETDKLVHEAFELEREIKTKVVGGREAWWQLAEVLYRFHEKSDPKYLGYEDVDEFLAQPEIGLSRRSYFRAVQLWSELIVVKQLPAAEVTEIEPSKAREVMPAIMRGDVKVEDALDDARALSKRDVIEKYRPSNQARHGQATNDSKPLNAADEPERVRCDRCGQWTTEDQLRDV